MATSVIYTSTGSGTFSIPFPYLSETHVKVSVNNVQRILNVNFTISGSTATLSPAPSSGASVHIYRQTDVSSAITTFQDGTTLNEGDLNAATLQNLYAIQELTDNYNAKITAVASTIANDGGVSIVNTTDILNGLIQALLDDLSGTAEVDLSGINAALASHGNSLADLASKLSIKIDANGYVTGYGTAGSSNTSTPSSTFVVLANKFAVVNTGQTPKVPFIVGTVGSTSQVGIDGSLIVNGTIIADAIAANTITAAKIAAQTITGDKVAANSITATNIDSRGLSIKDASGNVIFSAAVPLNYANVVPSSAWLNSNVTLSGLGAGAFASISQLTSGNIGTYVQTGIIDTAYIKDAAITNAKIGNLAVQTANIGDLNVTSLKIANGAVTVSTSAAATGSIDCPTQGASSMTSAYTQSTGAGAWTSILSATVTTTGNPLLILANGTVTISGVWSTGTWYSGDSYADIQLAHPTVYTNQWLPPTGSVTYQYRLLIDGSPLTGVLSKVVSLSAGTHTIAVQFRQVNNCIEATQLNTFSVRAASSSSWYAFYGTANPDWFIYMFEAKK